MRTPWIPIVLLLGACAGSTPTSTLDPSAPRIYPPPQIPDTEPVHSCVMRTASRFGARAALTGESTTEDHNREWYESCWCISKGGDGGQRSDKSCT
ncbi:MAG: hypothetical protein R3B09_09660 [Nannocystaceae bacterium]